MQNVIAYVRVSTEKQSKYGKGLDGQKRQIQAYCKAEELKIHRTIFSDDDSARHEEELSARKGFNDAIDLALKKGWPIIVADASRFSRTEASYIRFVDAGGRIYDTAEGFGADEAVMRGKIVRAQFDGKIRSEATREGQKKYRENGG